MIAIFFRLNKKGFSWGFSVLLPLSRFDWDDDIDDVPSHVCLEEDEDEGRRKEALIKIIMWNNFLLLAFFKKDFPAFLWVYSVFIIEWNKKLPLGISIFQMAIKKTHDDWVVDLDEVLKP